MTRPMLLLVALASACGPTAGKGPSRLVDTDVSGDTDGPGIDTDGPGIDTDGPAVDTDTGVDTDTTPKDPWCAMEIVAVSGDVGVTGTEPEMKVLFDMAHADKATVGLVDVSGTSLPVFTSPLNAGAGMAVSPASALEDDAVYFWTVALPCGGDVTVEPFYVDRVPRGTYIDAWLGEASDPLAAFAITASRSSATGEYLLEPDEELVLGLSLPLAASVRTTTAGVELVPGSSELIGDQIQSYLDFLGQLPASEGGPVDAATMAADRGLILRPPPGGWPTGASTSVTTQLAGPSDYRGTMAPVVIRSEDPCEVLELTPAAGTTAVTRLPRLEATFPFDVPQGATMLLSRGATQVPLQVLASGKELVGVPQQLLATGTSHRLDVLACGKTTSATFTTAPVPTGATRPQVVGAGWALDLGTGSVISPAGWSTILGSLLSSQSLTPMLFVQDLGGTSIAVHLGFADAPPWSSQAQQACEPTSQLGTTTLSSGSFSLADAEREIELDGLIVTLASSELDAHVEPPGLALVVDRVMAEFDIRDNELLFDGFGDSAEAICTTVASFTGTGCGLCSADSQPYCFTLVASDMRGLSVSPAPHVVVGEDTGTWTCDTSSGGCDLGCSSVGLMPKELALVLLGLLGWRVRSWRRRVV
ncbi:MAG: hypothetical protein H6732_20075 [Alphaproteobacteria bacterium]|nr:hypothetical protein [Alphaproteobacteria bacterium]